MRVGAVSSMIAINVALAAALVFLWSDPDRYRWSEPPPIRPALDDLTSEPQAEPIDVSRYRATLERPLFASTRRPAARTEAGADDVATADPLRDVRLLGMYGSGSGGGVLVSRGGKTQRVAFGEKIGDWTVTAEEGRQVSLVRNGGERRQLSLALNSAAAPSGAKVGLDRTVEPQSSTGAAGVTGAARSAAAARAGAASSDADLQAKREQRTREIAERINARRAQRGLPPIKEQ